MPPYLYTQSIRQLSVSSACFQQCKSNHYNEYFFVPEYLGLCGAIWVLSSINRVFLFNNSTSSFIYFTLSSFYLFTSTIRTPAFQSVRIRDRCSETKSTIVAYPHISRNVISPYPYSNVSKTFVSLLNCLLWAQA